jgi:hypothetical protein
MTQSQDFMEKMALPYFAHCQARIAPALHSIAWNKVALSGYIDVVILLKGIEPPTSYLRKIRAFYEHYEQIDTTHPLLGDLDTLSRNLIHLDKANSKAVTAFAVKWNSIVHALENLCFEHIVQRKINGFDQIAELLQTLIFTMMEENVLPRWAELLDQQQLELTKMFQLKNLPTAALAKVHFRYQFSSNYQTDQCWLKSLIQGDKELQDLIYILNKNFLRLVNLINEKVPEPERQIQANPAKQVVASPSQDYRFLISYSYDGNDEGEYRANFFSLLRNFLK